MFGVGYRGAEAIRRSKLANEVRIMDERMLSRWYRFFISNISLNKYLLSFVKFVQDPLKLFKRCCCMEVSTNQVAKFNEIANGADHVCWDVAINGREI